MSKKELPTIEELEKTCREYSKRAVEFFNKHGYGLDEEELFKELLKLCYEKMAKKGDENQ